MVLVDIQQTIQIRTALRRQARAEALEDLLLRTGGCEATRRSKVERAGRTTFQRRKVSSARGKISAELSPSGRLSAHPAFDLFLTARSKVCRPRYSRIRR